MNAIVYDAVAYFYLTIELISIAFISHYVIIYKSLCYNRIKNKVCCKNKPPKLISLGGLFFI